MASRKPPSQRDPSATVARLSRAVQSMSPGTIGGRAANASPISIHPLGRASQPATDAPPPSTGTGTATLEPERNIFSYAGPVGTEASAPLRSRGGAMTRIEVDIATAGTTDTTIGIFINNSSVKSFVLAASVTKHDEPVTGVTVAAGAHIRVRANPVGTGAQNLTLNVVVE